METITEAPVQKIYPQMTRARFTQFIQEVDVQKLGHDRAAWQLAANKLGFSIPSEWLTKHLTQLGTRQRQQDQAKVRHTPRKSARR